MVGLLHLYLLMTWKMPLAWRWGMVSWQQMVSSTLLWALRSRLTSLGLASISLQFEWALHTTCPSVWAGDLWSIVGCMLTIMNVRMWWCISKGLSTISRNMNINFAPETTQGMNSLILQTFLCLVHRVTSIWFSSLMMSPLSTKMINVKLIEGVLVEAFQNQSKKVPP